MAFVQNGFKGKINNKNTNNFIEKLDFSLPQVERVELTDKLLYTRQSGDNKFMDEYFEVYFDEKFNCNVTKEDTISSNNNVCKTLEAMANYILFADDVPKIKKTEYNFYTLNQLKNRFGKELSLDSLIEMTYKNVNEEFKLSFLLDSGKNYKKAIEQCITADDIKEIPAVADYEYFKSFLSKKLQNFRKFKSEKALQRKYIVMMKDLKTDSILSKDKIKGTIYFKNVMMDSTQPDYSEFDFYDIHHVTALIECKGSIISDVGCMVYDLRNLVEKVSWKTNEVTILNYLYKGLNTFEIGRELGENRREIKKKVKTIVKKIIRQYELELEDWYYTFIRKGKFKRCKKCGEIKLAFKSRFFSNRTGRNGLHSLCKVCKMKGFKKYIAKIKSS